MLASQCGYTEITKLFLEREGHEEESSLSCSGLETEMLPKSQKDDQSTSIHEQNHQEFIKTNTNTKVDLGTQTDNSLKCIDLLIKINLIMLI